MGTHRMARSHHGMQKLQSAKHVAWSVPSYQSLDQHQPSPGFAPIVSGTPSLTNQWEKTYMIGSLVDTMLIIDNNL